MKKLILLIVLAFSLITNAQEKSEDKLKKTDEVLSEVVKKALSVAEKTGNFAIEQAPLLLQEFYAWHVTENILSVLMWSVFIVIIHIVLKKVNKKKKEEDLDFSDEEYFFPVVFSWVGIIFSVIFLFISIYDLVFILVAPKLYLIEYFIK